MVRAGKSEFQAVVLAGYGQNLDHLVDSTPKPLLPIANTPMIEYVLRWLENAGISDILIVSTPESGAQLADYLSKVYESSISLGARIQLITPNDGTYGGSADALKKVRDSIEGDFIVVPCDIITDAPLAPMLDRYRLHDPSMVALLAPTIKHEYVGAGMKGKGLFSIEVFDLVPPNNVEPTLIMGLDSTNCRVLHMEVRDSLGSSDDRYSDISVHLPILNEHGSVNLHTNLMDAHVYVMKKWILDWMCSDIMGDEIASIKEDLLPLLVKLQFSKALREKLSVDSCISTVQRQNDLDADELSYLSCDFKNLTRRKQRHAHGTHASSDVVVCSYALNQNDLPAGVNYCSRVHSIPALFDMNRLAAKNQTNRPRQATSANISANAGVGPESVVGEGTTVSERASIKKSVIGAHCRVGKFAKISNSIVMDHVSIEDGVKLEGCIVCSGSTIKAKASLRDCEVGGSFAVPTVNAKGELFVESRAMTTDEDN